jgi:hypothetical protein
LIIDFAYLFCYYVLEKIAHEGFLLFIGSSPTMVIASMTVVAKFEEVLKRCLVLVARPVEKQGRAPGSQ